MNTKTRRKVTLEIEHYKAPSLNEINSLRWVGRYGKTRQSRGYGKWLSSAACARNCVPEPQFDWQVVDGPCTVTFTRLMCYGEKTYDDDNFVGGLKGIRDALVYHGYISGDGPKQGVRFVYRQKRDVTRETPSLLIEIVPRRVKPLACP